MNTSVPQETAEAEKKVVALIAGPTASGKSALALRLAEIGNGVVINADASQVYADLRVLSARPSAEEEARAPHRLFGYRDAATACSAADWAEDAKAEIAQAQTDGKLPIIVGGTGLYLRTLLFGIAPIPEIDADIREKVRGMRVDAAYRALKKEDPPMATLLRETDTTRVARALEVIRSTGTSILVWRERLVGGILESVRTVPAILLPPRDWLHERINRRFEAMLDSGAIEEVLGLRARHLDPELPAMRAIGVRDILGWRNGEIDYDTMLVQAQAASRQYAKRQYTWFRHQLPANWRRIETQLNDSLINDIAIKLHQEALTA